MIHSSTKLLPAWERYLEELKLRVRMMPRDVSTRWNSTYDMLTFAVEYRKAIDAISADRGMELRQFELSEHEWGIAVQLRDVLKVGLICMMVVPPGPHLHPRCPLFNSNLRMKRFRGFLQVLKDATLFFSQSTPNLATVIPAMDLIDENLTNHSRDRTKFDVSIRASVALSKKTLNRYYNMTDWSEVYRIAMGMSLTLGTTAIALLII
jgi:hypothetical protein